MSNKYSKLFPAAIHEMLRDRFEKAGLVKRFEKIVEERKSLKCKGTKTIMLNLYMLNAPTEQLLLELMDELEAGKIDGKYHKIKTLIDNLSVIYDKDHITTQEL